MCDRPTPESTRREGVPVRPIRLADGSDWGFLRPAVRLTPRVVSDLDKLGRPVERISVEVGFGYPPEVQALITALTDACEHGSPPRQYEAFFALAASLLRRAHDISLSATCELLSVSEDELPRLVREVVSICFDDKGDAGRGPTEGVNA
jgi:hypothetical protein